MKLTNKYNLPEPVYNFVANDKYSRGRADISATEVLGSPRIRMLSKKHADKMTADASERFWAALGTAVHQLMEEGVEASSEKYISEERLYASVDGVTISGGIDLQQVLDDGSVSVSDYKVTSVYAASTEKPDWEAQLNIYAFLVRHAKRLKVKQIQVVAMLRDWSASARDRGDSTYPKAPVVVIPQKLWSDIAQDKYVFNRIGAHKRVDPALNAGAPQKKIKLEPCTDKEMWARPPEFAVMGKGSRAVRVFDDKLKATNFSVDGDTKKEYRVEERPGKRVRCEGNYCGVSKFCDQYKEYKKSKQKG